MISDIVNNTEVDKKYTNKLVCFLMNVTLFLYLYISRREKKEEMDETRIGS